MELPGRASSGSAGPDDATEIQAVTDAMVRLLSGVPARSDGQLTVKSLAAEAGLKRNNLTHKHSGISESPMAPVMVWSQPAKRSSANN
ncbi:hypothetical protein ACWEQP_18745 [Streptomyces sp. NPDC004044]